MPNERCLVCVHAHPDDEALFSGGVMARYAAEGARVVLITCTDGSLGFAPDGTGVEDPGHDRATVAAARRDELAASAALLGVSRLVQLGHQDSGMQGWPQNDLPTSFVNQPLEMVAAQVGAVLAEERPQVVVTYDANGFYGHPDHVHAHRATMQAVASSGSVRRVYFPAIPQTLLEGFLDLARDAGLVLPEWLDAPDWGAPDGLVQTEVDCTAWVRAKHEALAAHATQIDNADLVGLPDELFDAVFGVERFIRGLDRTGTSLPETDLYEGIE